jgi:hypothetical protein
MGHPLQRARAEGQHRRWARGVAEGTDSEVEERERAWAEVIVVKAVHAVVLGGQGCGGEG